MAQLIGIYDGGYDKDERGRPVGVVHFRIVTREGVPETLTAHCLPNYKGAVIKNIKRLAFLRDTQEAGVGDRNPPEKYGPTGPSVPLRKEG